MRVIAGSAKGHKLKSVPGDSTRPVTDRVKEALFSILGEDIVGARVLDLFGGTGAVGIEALSRGAAGAVFIELSPAALRTIRENLEFTKQNQKAQLVRDDAFRYLKKAAQPFDIIYVAPPQYQGLWLKALEMIDQEPAWLDQGGQVIVQIHPREETPAHLNNLIETDRRKYGSTVLLFYEKA